MNGLNILRKESSNYSEKDCRICQRCRLIINSFLRRLELLLGLVFLCRVFFFSFLLFLEKEKKFNSRMKRLWSKEQKCIEDPLLIIIVLFFYQFFYYILKEKKIRSLWRCWWEKMEVWEFLRTLKVNQTKGIWKC